MKNILNIMSVISLISLFIVIIIVGIWELWPYKPLVFNTQTFPVITKTVKQGKTLMYTSNYCKYSDKLPLVSRTFADEILFATPIITANRPLGCNIITITIDVPQELPPGVYHLENTYTFQVNPLRTVVVREKSDNFTVIE